MCGQQDRVMGGANCPAMIYGGGGWADLTPPSMFTIDVYRAEERSSVERDDVQAWT